MSFSVKFGISLLLELGLLVGFRPGHIQKIDVVVLDAGHGGKDPGTGRGKEKKIALDITLLVGQKLKTRFRNNIRVIYTRENDVFVPLHERAAIANRNKADLFISIHCNANPHSSNIRGSETYVMGLHKTQENLDLAKSENRSILLEDNYSASYKGYNPSSPLAHIMMANLQSVFMEQSATFASSVEKHMKKSNLISRGVKQSGFLVLWETTMPSVLIETGYLTNSKDARMLEGAMGQEKIAEAIFGAFLEYKNQYENS